MCEVAIGVRVYWPMRCAHAGVAVWHGTSKVGLEGWRSDPRTVNHGACALGSENARTDKDVLQCA